MTCLLDISKALNKIWHKGLIHKLKLKGISGNILNTITDFLSFRKQRVILNGQVSQWTTIEAGDASRVHNRTTIIFDLY